MIFVIDEKRSFLVQLKFVRIRQRRLKLQLAGQLVIAQFHQKTRHGTSFSFSLPSPSSLFSPPSSFPRFTPRIHFRQNIRQMVPTIIREINFNIPTRVPALIIFYYFKSTRQTNNFHLTSFYVCNQNLSFELTRTFARQRKFCLFHSMICGFNFLIAHVLFIGKEIKNRYRF